MKEILSYLITLISSISLIDILDIVIVSGLLYYLFKFIRSRRAIKLAIGVAFLILCQVISELLNMYALKFLMQNIFQVGVLAIVIVFQPELRSVLEKMGGKSLESFKSIGEQKDTDKISSMISSLCDAMCDLSKEKTGALVVLENTTKLGDIIKSGTIVNAEMSPFLLRNIFFNKAPLHDGAVIIRNERIYAAGCFLPLSTNPDILKELGTRHRAALGMSENSDALVLVVSEETGTISLAKDGILKRNFDYISLKRELESNLLNSPRSERHGIFRKKNAGTSGGKKASNASSNNLMKEDTDDEEKH